MAFQQEKLQKTVLGKSREVLSSSDGPIRGQGQKPELGLPELHGEPKAVWYGCSPLQQQDVAANGSVPVLRTHTHTFTWCSQACVPQQPGNSLQSCCCISCHALSDCELSSSFLGPNTGGTRSSSSETDVRTNSSKQKQQDIVQGDFLPETLFLGFRSTNPE